MTPWPKSSLLIAISRDLSHKKAIFLACAALACNLSRKSLLSNFPFIEVAMLGCCLTSRCRSHFGSHSTKLLAISPCGKTHFLRHLRRLKSHLQRRCPLRGGGGADWEAAGGLKAERLGHGHHLLRAVHLGVLPAASAVSQEPPTASSRASNLQLTRPYQQPVQPARLSHFC